MGVLHNPMLSLIILILSYNLSFSVLSIATMNTITPNQSLSDGQTLVSLNQVFALGFFTPNGSTYSYLGIWYNKIPGQTVVWVGNRQAPLEITSNETLSLSSEGNLAVRNHEGAILWSTAASNMSNPVVELLDSGNLVLTDGGYDESDNSSIVWQSFDYPTDTLLPGMKLGWDLKAKRERRLTSWLSNSDPSPGPYFYCVNPSGVPELYIWKGSVPKSRGEPWEATNTGAINSTVSQQLISTNDEAYYTYEILDSSVTLRVVLNPLGIEKILLWQREKWVLFDELPNDLCDMYNMCGAFGVCNPNPINSPVCSCLRGFEPTNTSGCLRRASLYCPNDGDEFSTVLGVKLPATNEATLRNDLSFDQCKGWCLLNCSCAAFAFLNETNGCISWLGDLVDLTEWQDGGGAYPDSLYVRLSGSEFGIYLNGQRKTRRALVIVIVAVSLAVAILCSVMLLIWISCKFRFTYKIGMKPSVEKTILSFGRGRMNDLKGNERAPISPLYPLSDIVKATDNFSDVNKLGEGGFGPVYKGQLVEGPEIAVKRLAAKSRQGREEFENEIILIAKLQHRNLVRLLGYCISGEEKILIYEYMPNKSLDYFLFDTTRRAQLDWSRRLRIVEGISQGLIYLHKHSRLRIIHRDLKASNILLDMDMNPKISDFGLARIFGSNETEANTNRIVGTYGYMAPEYAAEGVFSIKSDVFSFGVLLLEIVSGSKNRSYHLQGNTLNLSGYAWELWKAAKLLELFDPSFDENCPKQEISRCIHVALMCVQENANDRPNMSDVVAMLSSDSAIPDPKHPAFFNVRKPAEEEFHSVNAVTVTDINGR